MNSEQCARFHTECHRGGDPLFESVSEYYWWPEINRDCHDYANACTLCGGVRSRSLAKAPIVPIATPSRPFSVVHVDHKGPLPRSGEYTNILVVVCALTRFTLYIPVPNVTAMETQKALMTHVFSIFGFPLVMISDKMAQPSAVTCRGIWPTSSGLGMFPSSLITLLPMGLQKPRLKELSFC